MSERLCAECGRMELLHFGPGLHCRRYAYGDNDPVFRPADRAPSEPKIAKGSRWSYSRMPERGIIVACDGEPDCPMYGDGDPTKPPKHYHEVADPKPVAAAEAPNLTWAEETMQIINRLTPDIKGKAFDPDWFLLRQRLEEFEAKEPANAPGAHSAKEEEQ